MNIKGRVDEEEKRMRALKFIVDLTQAKLMQSELTLHEAFELTEETKEWVLRLFPDKGNIYDLIYRPRFFRIIAERFVKITAPSIRH